MRALGPSTEMDSMRRKEITQDSCRTISTRLRFRHSPTSLESTMACRFTRSHSTIRWKSSPLGERARTAFVPFTYRDRKSTRLNSSHLGISYAVFCLKKKTRKYTMGRVHADHHMVSPHCQAVRSQ